MIKGRKREGPHYLPKLEYYLTYRSKQYVIILKCFIARFIVIIFMGLVFVYLSVRNVRSQRIKEACYGALAKKLNGKTQANRPMICLMMMMISPALVNHLILKV